MKDELDEIVADLVHGTSRDIKQKEVIVPRHTRTCPACRKLVDKHLTECPWCESLSPKKADIKSKLERPSP